MVFYISLFILKIKTEIVIHDWYNYDKIRQEELLHEKPPLLMDYFVIHHP